MTVNFLEYPHFCLFMVTNSLLICFNFLKFMESEISERRQDIETLSYTLNENKYTHYCEGKKQMQTLFYYSHTTYLLVYKG